jgi:primosomal protein N' (replication factor Y)
MNKFPANRFNSLGNCQTIFPKSVISGTSKSFKPKFTMKSEFAEVAVPLPIDNLFTYRIPLELQPLVAPGMRVLVPFGQRKITGFVVRLIAETSVKTIKPMIDVLDRDPAFSAELLKLAQWIGEYYLAAPGEVLKAMLPTGIAIESERQVRLAPNHLDFNSSRLPLIQASILQALEQKGELSLKQLEKLPGIRGLHYHVRKLEEAGILEVVQKIHSAKVKPKLEKVVRLATPILTESAFRELLVQVNPGAKKQIACLEYLWQQKQPVPQRVLLQLFQTGSQTVNALLKSGLLVAEMQEVSRNYYLDQPVELPLNFELNLDQRQALVTIGQRIESAQFQAYLLHGVTGSGKTQIYIEALKQVIQQGRGGIVLVPEISLTPQTVRRFQSNFPGMVAVLHSRMSPGERYDSWRKVKSGAYRVVVGARSAIFAPLENLGIVIVDEEHEASYKQFETNPLYHARDVAVVRAKMNHAVVILGSATPSVESYYNALTQKYQLIQLPRRIDDIPMPAVQIADMMREHRVYSYELTQVFSTALKKKIAEKLERQEQIILLQNRRGYSPFIRCKKCNHIEHCVNCNITMTYHKKVSRLRCHYCGYTTTVPTKCPECGDEQMVFKGVGTQKVEEELAKYFPEARVVRMDLDTTQGKLAHDKIITSFGQGKYDILLGTQMVAKGLDFHRVTLVGVISADTGLFLPDFRAGERTFQLLTQVAGRAGRKGAQGEVVIQTYSPDHVCLLLAQKHDFLGYFQMEEAARKELKYPPYGRLVGVLFKGENEAEVAQAAKIFCQQLEVEKYPLDLLGPTPAPLARIQNQFRWQVVIKSSRETDPSGSLVRGVVAAAAQKYRQQTGESNVRISIDVDPMALF